MEVVAYRILYNNNCAGIWRDGPPPEADIAYAEREGHKIQLAYNPQQEQSWEAAWRIEYQNDVGSNDEGFWEWWEVTDGQRVYQTGKEDDANVLCDLLNQKWPRWTKEQIDGARDEARELASVISTATATASQVSNTPQDEEVPGGIYVELERGALQLAINVLRRAGKSEVADELMKACRAVAPPQLQEQSWEDTNIASVVVTESGNAKAFLNKLAFSLPAGRYECYYSPSTPTASQESASGQEAVAFIDVWKKYMPAPMPEEMQTYRWCETFWKEGRQSIAPPTSTAIAAMVIKQAAEILDSNMFEYTCKAGITKESMKAEILALTPANAEAELEALMMKVARKTCQEAAVFDDEFRSIVRRVLDERK